MNAVIAALAAFVLSPDAAADDFIGADGFVSAEPAALEGPGHYAAGRFPGADPEGVFHPDGDLDPLARAVLLAEAAEPEAGPHRWRLTLHAAVTEHGGRPHPLYLVEAVRLNLAPALQAELEADHGERAGQITDLAPPHVAWRFVMRPVQGMEAGLAQASRRELTGPEAAGLDCLAGGCLQIHLDLSGVPETDPMSPPETPEPVYRSQGADGVSTSAHAVRETMAALRPQGRHEPSETASPGAPEIVMVVSRNAGGQDASITALAHETGLMDHETAEVWVQRSEAAGAPVMWARAAVPWAR